MHSNVRMEDDESSGYSMFALYVLFVIQDLLRNPDLNWWPAFQVLNFLTLMVHIYTIQKIRYFVVLSKNTMLNKAICILILIIEIASEAFQVRDICEKENQSKHLLTLGENGIESSAGRKARVWLCAV